MRRLIKLVKWYLKGRPRCQVCGKPIYNKVCIIEGRKLGSGCAKREAIILRDMAGIVEADRQLSQSQPSTEDQSYHLR